MKVSKIFFSSFTFILKLPIYFYKGLISPFLNHSCRFYPTCSNYFIDAIGQFGLKGFVIGTKRILRCRPSKDKNNNGYDPIPINIKGDAKWLF